MDGNENNNSNNIDTINSILFGVELTEVRFQDVVSLNNNLMCKLIEAEADLIRAKKKLNQILKILDQVNNNG